MILNAKYMQDIFGFYDVSNKKSTLKLTDAKTKLVCQMYILLQLLYILAQPLRTQRMRHKVNLCRVEKI